MVVAVGISVGMGPLPDVAVAVDGRFSPMPVSPMSTDLRAINDDVRRRLGREPDRTALSYPAGWGAWRVDRLLRDVRSTALIVDRYVTSGEAAVRWWLHHHPAGDGHDGHVLVHGSGVPWSDLTLVRVEAATVETVSAHELIAGDDRCAVARALADAAGIAITDLVAVLPVGNTTRADAVELGGELGVTVHRWHDGAHAVALGSAFAATL